MIDLNKLSKESYETAVKRGLGDNDLQTLKHCAGEVIEAGMSLTNWYCECNMQTQVSYQSELADVMMCILTIFGNHEWDIEQALQDCLEKNKARIKNDN
ncbi:hypothetical protein [Methanobrevibacter sp.]|uniref:hypothetical protein n=1 Tax=Methanobrevibacter sp. TaxID=66852 RepID=UPI00388F6D5E